MLTIQGQGVSSGIAIGPLHFFRRTSRAITRCQVEDTAAEWQRFADAQAKAMDYAAMTMAGAAELYRRTRTHPGALKDAVCSPGGSTIAGVRVLEQRGFRGAAMDCICAAYAKNKELGK